MDICQSRERTVRQLPAFRFCLQRRNKLFKWICAFYHIQIQSHKNVFYKGARRYLNTSSVQLRSKRDGVSWAAV